MATSDHTNQPEVEGSAALVQWAEEHPEAVEISKAIKMLLPGGERMPARVRLGLAWVSVQHGLSPFLNELFAMEIEGEWTLYPGVAAWRRAADASGLYLGGQGRPATPEERATLGCEGDDVAWVYEAHVKGLPKPILGYGIVTAGEVENGKTYRDGNARPRHRWTRAATNPWLVARTRAEKDALRQRFPLRWHTPAIEQGSGEPLARQEPMSGPEAAAELYGDW